MNLPDIAAIVSSGVGNPWVYLPAAFLLGALHALEPGHAKGLMAAFILAVGGTVLQAVVLGLSAAIGHSAIVFALAGLGLWVGPKVVTGLMAPWLLWLSGALMLFLAIRLWKMGLGDGHTTCNHGHNHDHNHEHSHGNSHIPHGKVTYKDIMTFGLSAGLLPCPSALAVLLICWQLGKMGLGITMVGAFSAGIGVSLVAVGIVAALGHGRLKARKTRRAESGQIEGRLERCLVHLPIVSGVLVGFIGVGMLVRAATL